MIKIRATKPPKADEPDWLIVPYIYAAGLATIAVLQLVGFGGFDFAGINYQTQGTATSIILISAAAIFSLPFLLRLNLSPLARMCSTILSVATPFLVLCNAIFMRDQITAAVSPTELIVGGVLGLLAIASFNVLGGEKSFVLKKHAK
jgi:hypothetical protein